MSPASGGPRRLAQNLGLLLGSLGACLVGVELAYRLFDPFPTVDPAEINHTEHGNLSQYDAQLGWRGVPAARGSLATWNRRVHLEHNGAGFRDVEHPAAAQPRPAVVFLGDSFAWGYEVSGEEMFVNRLRERLPGFEVFNLAHRGYGTDQSLLTFQQWVHPGELRLVVLVFSENDVAENDTSFAYEKHKPRFELVDGELRLRGVPVPRVPAWDQPQQVTAPPAGLAGWIRRSHFLSDLSLRLHSWRNGADALEAVPYLPSELRVTAALLGALKARVEAEGGRLLVVLVPSKAEIEGHAAGVPYQAAVEPLCRGRAIEVLDLAPALKASWRRTYYRLGMHWNPHGHALAADAIHERLQGRLAP